MTSLDAAILARISVSPRPAAQLNWAWDHLYDSGGAVAVGELTERLGWSGKHMIAQFRRYAGAPPKTVARIIRFERAIRLLESTVPPPLADVAHRCGYYDQAHLSRDFRHFAGSPPAEHLRLRHAEPAGE